MIILYAFTGAHKWGHYASVALSYDKFQIISCCASIDTWSGLFNHQSILIFHKCLFCLLTSESCVLQDFLNVFVSNLILDSYCMGISNTTFSDGVVILCILQSVCCIIFPLRPTLLVAYNPHVCETLAKNRDKNKA